MLFTNKLCHEKDLAEVEKQNKPLVNQHIINALF